MYNFLTIGSLKALFIQSVRSSYAFFYDVQAVTHTPLIIPVKALILGAALCSYVPEV